MSFLPGLRMVGNAPERESALTFVLDGCQPDEVGAALDRQGIAVRVGYCAQPIVLR
jgi:cysteine desulfurase / selenocysteine lyase